MARSAHADLLNGVEGHLAEIRHEIRVQMKRMAQLQDHVDEAREALRELSSYAEPA